MALRISTVSLSDIQSRLPREADARKAAKNAINRAMDAGKTAALKQVASDYAIKSAKLKPRIHTSRATDSNLSAAVTFRGGALNLADFETNPTTPQPRRRKILRARVGRQAGFKEYRNAFLIRTPGGIKAFRRTSSARKMGERYPITGVWGPSIPHILGARSVKDAVEDAAGRMLASRLDHEINRMLRGRGRQ